MSRRIDFNGLKLKIDNDERVLFANCESSNIAATAYNLDDKSMYVLFHSDIEKRFVYINVPPKKFFELASAESVGQHFIKNFKGKYEYFDEPNKF